MTHGDAIKKLLIGTNWNAAGIAHVLSCEEKDVWFVAERTEDRRLRECAVVYDRFVEWRRMLARGDVDR